MRVNASTTPGASMSPSVSTASCCARRFGCVFADLHQQGQRGRVAELAERLDGFAQHVVMLARRDDALERRQRALRGLIGKRFGGFAAHRGIR